ncbi:hypothetical protein MRX96_034863 [Rhipicephalus microplus]
MTTKAVVLEHGLILQPSLHLWILAGGIYGPLPLLSFKVRGRVHRSLRGSGSCHFTAALLQVSLITALMLQLWGEECERSSARAANFRLAELPWCLWRYPSEARTSFSSRPVGGVDIAETEQA